MSDFADYEPEDAWDADDDAIDMARNLMRRLDALDHATSRESVELLIGVIELRLAQYNRLYHQLSDRERLRVDQLAEDLPTLRERARHA